MIPTGYEIGGSPNGYEQPTHKAAHLQAPTHKPMLQLAKELFSCRRTAGN